MANQYLPHYTPTTPTQLFPQPQGSVYMINNSLEVANIPIGAGLSFAYCANEGLLYIKALQNGNPIFLTYRMTPYEGKQAEPTRGHLLQNKHPQVLISPNSPLSLILYARD